MTARLRLAQLLPLAAALAFLAGCGPRDVQTPEALAGHYEGSVAYRDETMPVDLDIELRDGRPAARVSLPAMLVRDQPVEAFEFRSPKVRFRLPVGGGTMLFDGWFRRDVLSGVLSGGPLPFTLNRNTLPRLGLRRVARRPDTLAVDTVRFAGGSVSLAGTLIAPRDSLVSPAVLVLGGEHGTRGDGLELADRFARAGFVALVFDSRGQGASAGDANVALADLELDAVEAMEFLRRRPGVDAKRVGLVGIGRGALLAPRVAARVRTAFVVAVSPPGVPLEQAHGRRGVPEWAKREAHADPAAPWAAIASPALVFFGERGDVLAREGAARVREALARGGRPARIEVVPRADDALRLKPRRGEPFDFPRVSPAALDTLFAWARRESGLPPAPPRLVPSAR
ncbi:MAG: dienelactone hydrolase family protein [Candidatus Eisenbacteria bacterium]|nr:dienelactone hydrolase family protein [Candidatus Eisenbacteria bacterium]